MKTVLCHNGYPEYLIDSNLVRRLQHLNNTGDASRPTPDRNITIPLSFYPGICQVTSVSWSASTDRPT
ncbi:hypothetical protein M514_10509 [Trichuris suis]|uniref:Uncharacterized protein n=1 Tax=Trichuris suis TaxID=68888 RepID=A0A085N3B6_9BILA|nr:hypothetical protein M513_10509 [Trichuris suis]KFD63962.1 hypothetical protein M514_10509 [Trichuris suis]